MSPGRGSADRFRFDPSNAPVLGRRSPGIDPTEAAILVDKPAGYTSHDVVRDVRQLLGIRRVGHTGTLDPMATGLLICLTGRCTRLSRYYLELEKEYEGTLRLGQTTASYDSDTPILSDEPYGHVTVKAVRNAARKLVGEIIQETPPYSAVRVRGERLHRRARRGDIRPGPPRVVTVYHFDITGKQGPYVDFRVVCSKGTYVRTLVRDIGTTVGVGAHLTMLRRTRIGEIDVEQALSMDELSRYVKRHPTTYDGEANNAP